MSGKGLLVVLSGPSGAGKDTVLKSLMQKEPGVRLSVSATTRAPREGEEDGKDYFFLSRPRFEELVENGKMLEHAEYCGNFYGTPSEPIEAWQAEGCDVILEIEVQGGAQIKTKRPDCVSIFILPPSLEVLEKRLRLSLSNSDVYINIAGGIRISEPAIDLGVVLAVVSSARDKAIDEKVLAFGEVGLSGEVRAVSQAAGRVQEAKKLGFTTVILPEVCREQIGKVEGIRLCGVRTVADAVGVIL